MKEQRGRGNPFSYTFLSLQMPMLSCLLDGREEGKEKESMFFSFFLSVLFLFFFIVKADRSSYMSLLSPCSLFLFHMDLDSGEITEFL